MDPDVAWQQAVEFARADLSEFNEGIHALAERVLALNDWLSKGGFPPWQPAFDPDNQEHWTDDVRVYTAVVYEDGTETEELYADWSFARDIANSAVEDGNPPAKAVTRYFRLLTERIAQ